MKQWKYKSPKSRCASFWNSARLQTIANISSKSSKAFNQTPCKKNWAILDMERTSRSTKLKGIKSDIKPETTVPYAYSPEIPTHGGGRLTHGGQKSPHDSGDKKNKGVLLRA